jgi:predicted dehydrogenase
LRRGIKVFCEKPLCETVEEASLLERKQFANDAFIQVGYIYRYAPAFEEIHRLLEEGLVLGKPLFSFFRLGGRGGHQEWKHKKEQGGGAINEMLVHMLDLALWFFGPLEYHTSSSTTYLPQRRVGEKLIDCTAEDYVAMSCRSPITGTHVHVQADLATPAFSQYVEIQAENGSFMGSIQPEMPSYLYLKEARGGYPAGKTEFRPVRKDLLGAQMADFVHCVLTDQWPSRNGVDDSVQLMKLMEKIDG